MQKELNLFKGLFQDVINISILHINNRIDFLNPLIEEVVKTNEGKVSSLPR